MIDADTTKKIISLLAEHHLTVTTVESCTGGRIAATITEIPGASDVFPGGFVTYQTWVKELLVDVDKDVLEKYDVVSEPVVVQMVKGGCNKLNTDFAVATTGYAGPSKPVSLVPVGTIWIGCGNKDVVKTKCLHLGSNRLDNIEETTRQALDMLLEEIKLKITHN